MVSRKRFCILRRSLGRTRGREPESRRLSAMCCGKAAKPRCPDSGAQHEAPRLWNGLVPNRWLSAKQGHGGSAAAHSGKPPAYRSSFPGILLRLRLSSLETNTNYPTTLHALRIASSAAQIGTRSFLPSLMHSAAIRRIIIGIDPYQVVCCFVNWRGNVIRVSSILQR
jgi:hypothetical protein